MAKSSIPPSFVSISPADISKVRSFLSDIFQCPADTPSFLLEAMAWKCFDSHPWWPGSRSYVLQTPAGIAAHACVAPVRFEKDGRIIESMQAIDWAAGRLVPAAGLLVFRHCLELGQGTLLAIGGSNDAKALFPQVRWFTRRDPLIRYARPVRPWRHLALSPKGWRRFARFGRNVNWWALPRLPDTERWSCRKALAGEEVFSHSGNFISISRTREWYDYLKRCPLADTELVLLEDAGRPRGQALLSHVRGSARVADFVVANPARHADRVAAFAALMRYVSARSNCSEVVAASSLEDQCVVFATCGLRPRGSSDVFLADPKRQMPQGMPLEITLAIGDAFYLDSPGYPFAC